MIFSSALATIPQPLRGRVTGKLPEITDSHNLIVVDDLTIVAA